MEGSDACLRSGLSLDEDVARSILDCICAAHGHEICGVLFRDVNGRMEFVRVANPAQQGSFFFPAPEMRRLERLATTRGWRIIAVVHSHKDSLELSQSDIASIEHSAYPWMVCVVRFGHLEFKCFGC